ncbi:MAG: DNA-processing protein DprA, partial [Pseudomonadota bacterium]
MMDAPVRDLPTPPRSEAAALAWLRLTRSRRVGPQTFLRLMGEAEGPEEAFANLPRLAEQSGAKGYQPCARDQAMAELEAGRAAGARLVFLGHRDYPARLAQIPDPPPVLWIKGRQDVLEMPAVALVGARNASSLGLRMAKRMATDLGAAGQVVVSGLARGIDTAAQDAALATGTIAVLAGGIDVIYPAQNEDLARKIAAQGVLVSENAPGLQPQARHFPKRNRLISGLSDGVVVLEGALKSGSLITARDALDQGREVMAVPGHPVDARAGGCNALIRDGAVLVRGAEDVLS